MESVIEQLDATARLRNPLIQEAIRLLELPSGSTGLDAGCGTGEHTVLLADAVGPGGHVTGLDLSLDLVARSRDSAQRSGHGDRVTFRQGNVNELPFGDRLFDWAWSVDCVGHATIGNPVDGIRELARVVRPGGKVIILAYSSQLLLPGHAQLEARLNATASSLTTHKKTMAPGDDFMRALGWFDAAGLVEFTARTVAGTVHAPLDNGARRGLLSLIEMLWGENQAGMHEMDRVEFRHLTDPKSPDFILDASDYCGFFTYSVFEGRVADGK